MVLSSRPVEDAVVASETHLGDGVTWLFWVAPIIPFPMPLMTPAGRQNVFSQL